jgi:hypothetical protein
MPVVEGVVPLPKCGQNFNVFSAFYCCSLPLMANQNKAREASI